MATIRFGNDSADMRVPDESFGIPDLRDFHALLGHEFPDSGRSILVQTPTQLVVRYTDGALQLIVTANGDVASGQYREISGEAFGVRETFKGNIHFLPDAASTPGTLNQLTAIRVADGSLIAAVSDIAWSVQLERLPTIDAGVLAGNDTITAGRGDDYVLGYGGNDWMAGGPGNDALDGGAGTDTAVYSAAFRQHQIALPARGGGAGSGAPIQWEGNGHYYEIVAAPGIDWAAAKAAAEARGGYLVTLTSAAENNFVFENLVNRASFWSFDFAAPFQGQAGGPWIGLKSAGSTNPTAGWQWLHGEGPLTYQNWLPFEPNNYQGANETAVLFYDNSTSDPPQIKNGWNDWSATNKAPSYLIEYDALPFRVGVTGPDGTDTLTSIENLAFVDGRLTFDLADPMAQAYRLYFATLGRAPDALGLNFQSARLDAGTALTNVAAGFVNSTEFQATYGSLDDAQFVDLLYRNVLDRAAAPGEIAFHVERLQSGASRSDVVVGFSESPEHIQKHGAAVNAGLWDIDESMASVARLYFGMLERTPETSGLAFYKQQFANGLTVQQVANGFAASPEFQAKYGPLDNAAYVKQLYENILERSPGADEVAFHVNRLAAGASRGDVAAGFTEAPEYQVKMLALIDDGIAVSDAGFVLT